MSHSDPDDEDIVRLGARRAPASPGGDTVGSPHSAANDTPATSPGAPSDVQSDSPPEIGGEEGVRPGDSGVGRRRQCLPSAEAVAQERKRAQERTQAVAAAARDPWSPASASSADADAADDDDYTAGPRPRLIAGVASFVVAGGAVLAFFAYTSLLGTLASLGQAPTPLRWAGWIGLGLLCAALLWTVFRVALFWRGLRPNAPVPWLKVQAGRGAAGARTWERAEEALRGHMRSYETHWTDDDRTPFARLVHREARARLRRAADRLLTPRFMDGEPWVREYEREFLAVLDACADAAVQRRARMVAYQTMLLPGRALDVVISLYHSAALLEELARIYQQRTNRHGTWGALARIVLTAGAAGGMEAATETAGEAGAEAFLSLFPGLAAETAARATGQVLGKLAEGGANYALAHRLGRRIQRALRPLTS